MYPVGDSVVDPTEVYEEAPADSVAADEYYYDDGSYEDYDSVAA